MNQIQTTQIQAQPELLNTVVHGDCSKVMSSMTAESIDFILADPPYLVNFRDRQGRGLRNDINTSWLDPAFAEAYRVLKQDRFCLCFYGWAKADRFFQAWRRAGFYPVGHLVFRKSYASMARFVRYQHEQAYLLAKGRPPLPAEPISDVLEFRYTGNKLHPTQKAVSSLLPLVRAFSLPGDIVLDPFCGSGSSLVAAKQLNRRYLGIELDDHYFKVAHNRLAHQAA
jgi:DNA modification methylase